MGNGVFWFIGGCVVLYIVGKGYGKNLGAALNTLMGGSGVNPAVSSAAAANAAGIGSGVNPAVNSPAASAAAGIGSIPYLGGGVSIA